MEPGSPEQRIEDPRIAHLVADKQDPYMLDPEATYAARLEALEDEGETIDEEKLRDETDRYVQNERERGKRVGDFFRRFAETALEKGWPLPLTRAEEGEWEELQERLGRAKSVEERRAIKASPRYKELTGGSRYSESTMSVFGKSTYPYIEEFNRGYRDMVRGM